MITAIPFSGFYDSIHSYYLERSLIDDEECKSAEQYEAESNKIDWKAAHIDYAKAYTKALSKLLKIEFVFSELESPREYNFTTDRIFCEISDDAYRSIFANAVGNHKAALAELVRARFSSRPGFISHYSSYLDDWLRQGDSLDHNQIETLIECYLIEEEGENWEENLLDAIYI
jgi:hypothetical protein